MADTPRTTLGQALSNDIDAWAENEFEHGDPPSVPDFWDECDTSERLAEWLIARGWMKP